MRYEFLCGSCGKVFEEVIAIKDFSTTVPLIVCPYCESYSISRIYNPVTIVYNSDGFTKKVNNENTT